HNPEQKGHRRDGRPPEGKLRCVIVPFRRPLHSHSIAPGGFDVTSYTTRFTPFTSLMIRVATLLPLMPPQRWRSGAKQHLVHSSSPATHGADISEEEVLRHRCGVHALALLGTTSTISFLVSTE